MRILRSALVGWALLGLAAATQLTASCARAPEREPALWRIADHDSEIWLFGSVHVLPRGVRWQGPRVRAAFAAADEFVTEMDASAESAAAFAALTQRYGVLPEGQSLSALMAGGEERERLERVARGQGLDPASLERLRPWLAALQLSYAAAARAGHSSQWGVETVLTAQARAEGKRLSFLETAEQQVRVLADLEPRDEMLFLNATLDEIEAGGDILEAMDAAWASGDVAALEAMLDAQWAEGGEALYEAVVLERNRAWTGEIARRLEGSGRIFIAVGAAHLVGEDSVIALLRERGFTVEGP